jgi:DNA-binding transcriptional LysR family regulator
MTDVFTGTQDLDLRFVRYFTVVAREGNFGRAAQELHLPQPTLSRYIQRFERDMGARLLERTPQGSRLTPAGEVFLPQALSLLQAARKAASETRDAGDHGVLTIGYVGDLIITPAVHDLRTRHPEIDVRTTHLNWTEVRPALIDHRVGAVVARSPFPTEGLSTTILYTEPRVLLVPIGHRLAQRDSVLLEDFRDEPLVRYPDAAYDAFWRATPRPDGTDAPDGPLANLHHDKLETVAAGHALALAPAGRGAPRPDLKAIPVTDIEPCSVALAARSDDRRAPLIAFLESARRRLAPAA